MGKPAKSQWDFGELFPVAETRRILTVTELTAQVKRLLESQVGQVWVTGEVSNLRVQSSGHSYFTLKDAGAQLACVLFRGQSQGHRELLEDGRKVRLAGDLTVYEPRGQYQIIVTQVELEGVGALQLAFERLKQKLNAEGLFDPARKRPIPRFPQRVGLVTSPTGAALRDVLHVVQRRNPALELVLVPCRVQGAGAAEEIAAAIRRLNDWSRGLERALTPSAAQPLDLILVTRGGGSLEDLWAFNEEVVARAIAASGLPVISAVGHEIDYTISDFVADLRAATPSAAAELITEGAVASREFLAGARSRLRQLVGQRWGRERESLRQWGARLRRAHPRRRLNEGEQRLDDLSSQLARAGRVRLRGAQAEVRAWAGRWTRVRPRPGILRRRAAVSLAAQRLRERARVWVEQRGQHVAGVAERLRLLSPQHVLARGYSITRDAETGRVIRRAAETRVGQNLRTRLQEGEIRSVVGGA